MFVFVSVRLERMFLFFSVFLFLKFLYCLFRNLNLFF